MNHVLRTARRTSQTIPEELNQNSSDSSKLLPKGNSTAKDKSSQQLNVQQISHLVHQESHTNEEDDLFVPPDSEIPLDDYLESSARLLHSLWEEDEPVDEPRTHNNLFTPLGISSIFIFLITGVLLGSALIYRDVLNLPLNSSSAPNTTQTPLEEIPQPELPSIPNSPNLAKSEFIDLNLASLSTLEITPTKDEAIKEETSNEEKEDSKIDQSSPVADTTDTNTNYYYLLAEYTGDRSLEKVQSVVERAYLVDLPQGTKIYLGAFHKQADANKFVEALKQREISAYIFQPQQ